MRLLLVAMRLAFVPMALLAIFELANTNYVVKACAHGGYCDSYSDTKSALVCADTCADAEYNANQQLQADGFPGCNGADGTCAVEHYTITIACYFNGSQYCEELSQDYGCFFCV